MRRGPKPAKSKEATPPVARKSSKDDGVRVRDLEKRLAEALSDKAAAQEQLQTRDSDLVEAREQQTATSEILRVISSSPTDVQPVFDALAESAVRLCGAAFSGVFRFDGKLLHLTAHAGLTVEELEAAQHIFPTRALPGGIGLSRVVLDRTVLQIADIRTDVEWQAALGRHSSLAPLGGYRTFLAVPLLHDDVCLGAINVWRREVSPFSDQQIDLLKTFADQAVIAIENVRLFTETKEALERQTATAEILRVISSSPADTQPVFDAIARSALRLCESTISVVSRFDGEFLHLAAHNHVSAEADDLVTRLFPTRPSRNLLHGRVVLDATVVHLPDIQADPEYQQSIAATYHARSGLGVPMLLDGRVLGVIAVARQAVRPFSDTQIELMQTFADQAVIAIENVRLFKELQEKNRALTESLEQQTVTADILQVISRSPTVVQPVFEALVRSASRLCQAPDVAMLLVEGDELRSAAGVGPLYMSIPADFRIPLTRGSAATRAVLDRAIIHIHDFTAESEEEFPVGRELARRFGHRSMLAAPILREGVPIGVICAFRLEVRPFPSQQIALLRTFADQAVIAIENVRLFTELQEKNGALTEAHATVTESLERQTATSEILRVISRSPTDVQPVFDSIAKSAVRLYDAIIGAVYRVEGGQIHMVAQTGIGPEGLARAQRIFPMRLGESAAGARAIFERSVVQVSNTEAPEAPRLTREAGRAIGFRSQLTVPMLRNGEPIGVVNVARREPGAFSQTHVELLKTFADQAVIAIENVRLFKELELRNTELTDTLARQTATGEVLSAISRAQTDAQPVFEIIAASAFRLCGAEYGSIQLYDGELLHLVAAENANPQGTAALRQAFPRQPGEGVGGRVIRTCAVVEIPDVFDDPAYELKNELRAMNLRGLLAVPMVKNRQPIGAIIVGRAEPGPFSTSQIELLKTFADQAVIAIENVRLFKELEAANRELAAASQHKSEFLANMSHELRTPLNAIIGFSEVLSERMFGELNEKQEEYSKDIHASGQHLLALINDILDLSKIEAGRMELELSDFDLPAAIENALMLVRERAGRRSIVLHTNIDNRLGQIQADERKVRQVVLNLLSNAIKFTPEGGRIEVAAVPKDGLVEVSVSDTGVGIAPEDQEAVFEEFRQVGTADEKVEGTGLGLTLCRKFVELHGGKIWVKSELGVGSTFTFTIPVRRGE